MQETLQKELSLLQDQTIPELKEGFEQQFASINDLPSTCEQLNQQLSQIEEQVKELREFNTKTELKAKEPESSSDEEEEGDEEEDDDEDTINRLSKLESQYIQMEEEVTLAKQQIEDYQRSMITTIEQFEILQSDVHKLQQHERYNLSVPTVNSPTEGKIEASLTSSSRDVEEIVEKKLLILRTQMISMEDQITDSNRSFKEKIDHSVKAEVNRLESMIVSSTKDSASKNDVKSVKDLVDEHNQRLVELSKQLLELDVRKDLDCLNTQMVPSIKRSITSLEQQLQILQV